jgi:biotin carboxyl carrier protein
VGANVKTFDVRVGDTSAVARVDSPTAVHLGDVAYEVHEVAPGQFRVSDGSSHWDVTVAGPAESPWLFCHGHSAQVEIAAHGSSAESAGVRRRDRSGGDLSSPMPATVTKIIVEAGAIVKRGDTLLMLEAMKMELPVRAPRDGVVTRVNCKPGEMVQPGAPLLELE